ncbi:hypothetical protein DSU30_08865, partial [Campylobacter jejuni]|nr:hypothetical protein [Campylobacter jejuni]EAL6470749.1 hypothetical protein [Campylobacter jejuni]EKM1533799.1 hypothetical protein [Campylobacter jejuni]
YEATECFSLETKISKKSIFDSVKSLNFLLKVQKMKDNHQIEKMKCIGKNDDGIESIFNLDSYLKKIEFNLELDENGIYDAQKVKDMVLRKINSNQG